MKRMHIVKNEILTHQLRLVGNAHHAPREGNTKVHNNYE